MPELPDITVYLEALEQRILGQTLLRVHLASPFILRTFSPPIASLENRPVTSLQRIGKRIVLGFPDDHWLVIHLMIAGRLQWLTANKKGRGAATAASFVFSTGSLALTEAGTQRRASLHVLKGKDALNAHDPGGLETLTCTLSAFSAALTASNHTLKRALTDPRIFSGIGNAYSDEILHHAQLSPVTLTQSLSDEERARLFASVRSVLQLWTARLREEAGREFPSKVTAFHPAMAVHGKFMAPCPRCGTPIQRIRYAENEVNYCPRCQTGGKLLADRSLSRLLKQDWPRTIEEAEARLSARSKFNSVSTPAPVALEEKPDSPPPVASENAVKTGRIRSPKNPQPKTRRRH
ncbi:MAG TPA: DNA-formamidopyrimidine glycosylase family protein [Opitutaceae bacterium]|nr:DNA-formamidopyrimidine glycosylase family protein [Opitutaceae bacterium]